MGWRDGLTTVNESTVVEFDNLVANWRGFSEWPEAASDVSKNKQGNNDSHGKDS